MKKHIIRITSVIILLFAVVIPGTFSGYNDHELSAGEWGTGSVEIELKSKKEHKSKNNFHHWDHDSKDDPSAFEVRNIGSQGFFYVLEGEVNQVNRNKCDEIKITIWKDKKGKNPIYKGKLIDLHVLEADDDVLLLESAEKDLWWYQMSVGKKSEQCKASIVARAYQGEGVEAGGYQDESLLNLKKDSSGHDKDDKDWHDDWGKDWNGGIFEKILHHDKKLKVKRYGPFLLVEFRPDRKMNRASFAIRYKHHKDGKKVTEQSTGQIELNALGEFIIPELYIGTCSTDEISCIPHEDVTELNVSLLLKNNQEIVENVSLPIEW